MLIDDDKIVIDPSLIRNTLITYYSELLCERMVNGTRLNMQVIQAGPIIPHTDWPFLYLNFSADEIKNALCCINDNKSLGLDVFNNKFYKVAWSVGGQDVVTTIQLFFTNGQ